MYPVRLGFNTAKKRIRKLIANGHYAEALLTSVFTFEKTIHRTLKQLIISAGFSNPDADKLLHNIQGFSRQKEIWGCFDPKRRKLPDIIGNSHWQYVNNAVRMRNDLVHGTRVYPLDKCKEMADNILQLIEQAVAVFNDEYGYDGWRRVVVRRKSALHSNPKVKI